MIVDITNELLTLIKNGLSGVAEVTNPNPDEVPTFPHVTFKELENLTDTTTIDSFGEKHNNLAFEIEIFTEGATKMSEAKALRDRIDGILSPLGLSRNFASSQPNFLDSRIYRYIVRYTCTVDESRTIYRR